MSIFIFTACRTVNKLVLIRMLERSERVGIGIVGSSEWKEPEPERVREWWV